MKTNLSKYLKAVATAAAFALSGQVAMAQDAAGSDGWRTVEAERLLIIETTKGRILVEMNPDIAPLHVERIRQLAGEGFYDNVKWHRVIDGFMAQTGDPTGTGEGGSTHGNLKAEFTFRRNAASSFVPFAHPQGMAVGLMDTVPVLSQHDRYMARATDQSVSAWAHYCPGVAGMARDTPEDSADSQFFLMRDAYPSLDKRYTVWGRVIEGQDVVNSLNDSPLLSGIVEDPDLMQVVRTADQLPEAFRPLVRVTDTRTARYAAEVEQVRAARGADFSVCDLPIRVQVQSSAL